MPARRSVVVIRPGGGSLFRIAADQFRTKGGPKDRTEAFSVIEYEGAAGVPGPPPHIHRSFEEAWFLLEGEVTFVANGRSVIATPGTYVMIPRGVPHTFRVTGSQTARWLGIFSPGKYVGLVEELGALIPLRGPPNFAEVARLFAKYDSELAGSSKARAVPPAPARPKRAR